MIINKIDRLNSQELIDVSPNRVTIKAMLEVYKSVINKNGVLYCSAPITSGKRYIDWLESIGKNFVDIDRADKTYHDSHFEEVIEPNRKHAQHFIWQLRKQTEKIVIDPTALPPIPEWKQQDWHLFWRQVIERYVSTVFLVDDWQYSNGCVHEFWIAQKNGIPTLNENQQTLNLATGIDMIAETIVKVQQRGGNTTFVEEILNNLKSLSTSFTRPKI
ncbi:MAG: hypothetical protein AB4368_16950 [Xenococcaceae cyanobacterium]